VKSDQTDHYLLHNELVLMILHLGQL